MTYCIKFLHIVLPAGETVSLASLPIDIIEASHGREVTKLSVASFMCIVYGLLYSLCGMRIKITQHCVT